MFGTGHHRQLHSWLVFELNNQKIYTVPYGKFMYKVCMGKERAYCQGHRQATVA